MKISDNEFGFGIVGEIDVGGGKIIPKRLANEGTITIELAEIN